MVSNIFRNTYPSKPSPSGCKKKGKQTRCPCIKSYLKNDNETAKFSGRADDHLWMDEPMDEAEIFYVVYHAFILKLKKHSQVFKDEVLPSLHKMRQFQKSLLSPPKREFFSNFLGNSMPSDFENIKI